MRTLGTASTSYKVLTTITSEAPHSECVILQRWRLKFGLLALHTSDCSITELFKLARNLDCHSTQKNSQLLT